MAGLSDGPADPKISYLTNKGKKLENKTKLRVHFWQVKCIHPLQWPGACGGAGKIRNGMQGARDCHGSRILSAGSGGGVPRRECMQCGGIWGTRLDPQVSLGAGLGGAVLVVSPRGMRRKGPGKTSPSLLFWTKKWPYGPLLTSTPCSPGHLFYCLFFCYLPGF